jgi:hypothetical protein
LILEKEMIIKKNGKSEVDAQMRDNHQHPTCAAQATHGDAAACIGARP